MNEREIFEDFGFRTKVTEIPNRNDIKLFLKRIAKASRKAEEEVSFDQIYQIFKSEKFDYPEPRNPQTDLFYFCVVKVLQLSEELKRTSMDAKIAGDEKGFVLFHDFAYGVSYIGAPLMYSISERPLISGLLKFSSNHVEFSSDVRTLTKNLISARDSLVKDPSGFETVDKLVTEVKTSKLNYLIPRVVIAGSEEGARQYKRFYREISSRMS